MQTAIQLYTLRNVEEPLPAILERVADAGYDGVEFAYRLHDADLEAVVETLDETGLETAAAHVGTGVLDEYGEYEDAYAAVGCEDLIVPAIDDEHFADAAAAREAADWIGGYLDLAEDVGADLHYHNHDFEFVETDEGWAYEVFADALPDRVGLEIDVGWVQAGGGDPAALIERYGDRVDYLHVTDVVGGDSVEVGDGEVDLAAVGEAARGAGVEWLVYEHDSPADPLDSMARGADALADL